MAPNPTPFPFSGHFPPQSEAPESCNHTLSLEIYLFIIVGSSELTRCAVSLTAKRACRLIHGNYFNRTTLDELGSTSDEELSWCIDTLRDYTMQLGFTSVFNAVLATARTAYTCSADMGSDTNPFGNHSSTVDAAAEVEPIVSKLLGDNLCCYIPGRKPMICLW
jgi:hypothetical protein